MFPRDQKLQRKCLRVVWTLYCCFVRGIDSGNLVRMQRRCMVMTLLANYARELSSLVMEKRNIAQGVSNGRYVGFAYLSLLWLILVCGSIFGR